MGFEKEELEWLLVHLKKVMELPRFMGFNSKFRGKTRMHLLEEKLSTKGKFQRILQFVIRQKVIVILIPKGLNSSGWGKMLETIVSLNKPLDQSKVFKEAR